MLCKLLLLSALLCVTLGQYCGPLRRICGINAECVNGRCVCKAGYEGLPLAECHLPDSDQGVLYGDVHVIAFALAKANLNWPCKVRLTRLQHPLKHATPGLGFCAFEVFGYSRLSNGRYFVSGMEISLAIGDMAHQSFHQQDIIKFDITQNGVLRSNGNGVIWGSGVHYTWNNITVSCEYDEFNRTATLYIERCGFLARFRPFNSAQPTGPQSWVPFLSIIVTKDAIFGKTELGRFPLSILGETEPYGDGTNLYENHMTLLGLESPHMALLHAAMTQHLTQESYISAATPLVMDNKTLCQESVDEFSACTPQKKTEAINTCGRILKRLAKCAGMKALEAFNACLIAFCSNKAAGCSAYDDIVSGLNSCPKVLKVENYCD